ncbi:MAG: hypothetical protein K2M31_01990 [Muribaculaceae bacterium]|nr:hypothetical protein [Muribaculaceae bacterium]
MKKFYAFAAAALLATAANAQNLYITGAGAFANGEWNAETPDEFAMVNGQYEIEVANLTQFKISTECGDWDAFNTGVRGCEYGEQPGVAVALEEGWTGNIATPWKGDYKVVVSADLATITLTTDSPKPTGPVTIYLRGDMNSWGADEAWALTPVETTDGAKVWKFEFAEEQQIAVGEAFKIADADWNAYNAGGDGSAASLDLDYEMFNGGNPANVTLDEACNGVIWFGLDIEGQSWLYASNDKTAKPEWALVKGDDSAVAAVEVADEAPVYYNLQGVRVANPANGIYVKVVAGKATKAVVK